jgi:stalled ribosome rescue protein Dom34
MLEGRNRMISETAERAVSLADADGFIVVGGIKRVVKRIVSLLSEMAPGRVLELESLDIHAPLSEIADAAKQGASDLRAAIDNQRLGEIAEQAGAGGLGALGPEETRLALEQSSVRDLYLTHQFLEDHAADAERAVRAALDQQAVVEEVSSKAAEDLERLGGMAAGLRFRPISLVR